MSEVKIPIRSLNGHALVDEQARAAVTSLSEEIEKQQTAIDGKADKEGEWELIETITISEAGITSVERTKTPSGSKLSLKALMVTTENSLAVSELNDQVGYVGVGTEYTILACGSYFASSGAAYVARYIFRPLMGVYDVFGYHGQKSSISNMIGQAAAAKVITIEEMPSISYVRYYTYGNGLPIGMIIKIYGVRA